MRLQQRSLHRVTTTWTEVSLAMRWLLLALNFWTQSLIFGGLVIAAEAHDPSWFVLAAVMAGLTILVSIVLIKPERMH